MRAWAAESVGRRVTAAAGFVIAGWLVLALDRPAAGLAVAWVMVTLALGALASAARPAGTRATAFALLSIAPLLAAGAAVLPRAAARPAPAAGSVPRTPSPGRLVGTDRPAGVPANWVRHTSSTMDVALWLPPAWSVHDGSADLRDLPDLELVGYDPAPGGSAEADVFVHALPPGASAAGYVETLVRDLAQDPEHAGFRSDLAELGGRQAVHVRYVSTAAKGASRPAFLVDRYFLADGLRVYQLFVRMPDDSRGVHRAVSEALPAGFEAPGGQGSTTAEASPSPTETRSPTGPLPPVGLATGAPPEPPATIDPSGPLPLVARRSESPNWAGYVADAGRGRGFVDVRGRWTQPAVRCAGGATRSLAIWVGLDADPTVEQIGSLADCRSGSPVYRTWFQLYPEAMHPLEPWELAVRPGDVLDGEVRWAGGTEFTLSLRNVTTGGHVERTVSAAGAARATADWVVEAPSSCDSDRCVLPLADFGTAGFAAASASLGTAPAAVDRGDWSLEAVDMVGDSGNVKATVGPLSRSGTAFQVRFVSSAVR